MKSVTLRLSLVVVALTALAPQLVPLSRKAKDAQSEQPGAIIIQAGTVLDGRGHALQDVRIVVQNGKILRLVRSK